jgi:hypothetical protein
MASFAPAVIIREAPTIAGCELGPVHMSFTHRNHYVPEWYQKRFFDPKAKEAKYHYLKLRPETKVASNGHRYWEKDLNFWGSPRCFFEEDLYTTRFGSSENDDIEGLLCLVTVCNRG